ncbi:MAG: bifunctional metallophosphatase/5'-nucleotidase [Lachnospiraceae bacterium]|nr:bifunctional metallophosphatase/5'-nucleotidase [Lachnospiraceae bacterium]
MKRLRLLLTIVLVLMMLSGCAGDNVPVSNGGPEAGAADAVSADEKTGTKEPVSADTADQDISGNEAAAEKNGEIYILYTSDVHCGVDEGFGYAGLYEYRKSLEEQGYTTILVDDGDAVQGGTLGTLTRGEAVIRLMNELDYDVAIPGNHEFDFGMEQFMRLVEMADFPYISCNFSKDGELVFKPYEIIETGGKKIAFVGITTPKTLVTSNPTVFHDEKGRLVYGFMEDGNGSRLYDAVQKAVDEARAEGADYVYAIGHMGLEETAKPYTYADVISHTNGIDVFLDGHSHDTEQVVMKNKDGKDVIRSAVGTKMSCIGYSHITDEGIAETEILSWPNKTSLPSMLKIDNPVSRAIAKEHEKLDAILTRVIAKSNDELTINDPVEKDSDGIPVRMVRRTETNLGDLCADSFRVMTGADIGLINGGGIRDNIKKGDITYGGIISVFPFDNRIIVMEASGQQILDALEWGARAVPEENGGFLQVSGLTYEIDTTVKSPCISDEEGLMTGISGERRVKNVMVGGEPVDPKGRYKVASINFVVLDHGDGHTAFDGAEILTDDAGLDNQLLIDYITNELGGVVGEEYEDPYGQGRIVITE